MYPGLGKLIRSWALSHCTINKPHDMSLLSHSPSPDQLPFLCAPLIFATYYVIYGACTATSAPTVTFNLYHLYIQIKRMDRIHLTHLTLHLCPMPTLTLHTHTSPPLLSYLLTYLFYQAAYSLIQHSFTHLTLSLPPPLSAYYYIMHSCMLAHVHAYTTPPLFSSLHTHIETVPYPLISSHPQNPIGLLLWSSPTAHTLQL